MAGDTKTDFSSVTKSNNQDIDGILSNFRWSSTVLTYSFPDTFAEYTGFDYPEATFSKFSDQAKDAARRALGIFENYTLLVFQEKDETETEHYNFRFANSNDKSLGTATGGLPGFVSGGDMHFNNTLNPGYSNPVLGSYDFYVTMHEIGHALGLNHGHETTNPFGALPTDHDSSEYSIMTYRAFVGAKTDAIYNEPGNFPQTLMMDDIAALQYLYGAWYGYNGGDTVYKWFQDDGQTYIDGVGQGTPADKNVIFLTIWDGGGTDTYDLSGFKTDMTIDLNPGQGSIFNKTQLADLDTLSNSHMARAPTSSTRCSTTTTKNP